jgi:Yip1 domain
MEVANMNNPAAVGSAPAETSTIGGSFRGLMDVFFRPSELFQKLKERPSILVPFLVYLVVMGLFLFATVDIIVDEQVNSPQFKAQMAEQGQQLPVESVKKMMSISTLSFGILAMALIPIVAAALALFWGNFVWAGKATFRQLMSVMSYAGMIHALSALALLPLVLAKGSMLVTYSLGSLVPNKMDHMILYTALSKIDLFIIWEIIVIGIGISIIYNFSRNKGLLISVLSMGMLSILNVIVAAIGVLAQ